MRFPGFKASRVSGFRSQPCVLEASRSSPRGRIVGIFTRVSSCPKARMGKGFQSKGQVRLPPLLRPRQGKEVGGDFEVRFLISSLSSVLRVVRRSWRERRPLRERVLAGSCRVSALRGGPLRPGGRGSLSDSRLLVLAAKRGRRRGRGRAGRLSSRLRRPLASCGASARAGEGVSRKDERARASHGGRRAAPRSHVTFGPTTKLLLRLI